MSSEDIYLVLGITTFLSIYFILQTRYRFSAVPWWKILIKPDYFGGWSILLNNIGLLSIWVIFSNVLMLLVGYATLKLGDQVSNVYEFLDYEEGFTGKPGVITLGAVTICVYWFIINKTRRLVIEKSEYISSDYIFSEQKNHTSLLVGKKADDPFSGGKIRNMLRFVYYLIPGLLAPIYSHFYHSSGLIIHGCVRLLDSAKFYQLKDHAAN